ncbi:MAG: AsmA-like C-terminal domain-containing protein [Thermodesulfobacteriota bacterium]
MVRFCKIMLIPAAVCLLIIALLGFATPRLLTLAPVRDRITAFLGAALGGHCQVKTASLAWLPSPHLDLEAVRVSNDMMAVDIPEASARYHLWGSPPGRPPFEVTLQSPALCIKTLGKKPARKKPAGPERKQALPGMAITVRNGRIVLPSDGFLSGLAGQDPPLEIAALDATVAVDPAAVDIRGACRLPFIERLTAAVRLENRDTEAGGRSGKFWTLDIQGEGIDLTAAREKVLSVFANHRVAGLVCGIVRGGRAKSGGFAFQGYTADFKKLSRMRITALAENAVVQVPGVDLDLVDASGPITIENAVLTGANLSATLGNSFGRNGALRLGLLGEDRAFHLDLDIDADIAELPDLLKNHILKNNPAVVDELGRIDDAGGRARARLSIGDTLRQPAVRVLVSESNSRLVYRRLQHPVSIKKGTLEFYPGAFSWSQVNAALGPHVIHHTDGTVSWQDGLRLEVKKADADIQTEALYRELLTWPAVQEHLPAMVRSIRGLVRVRSAGFMGTIARPADWKYEAGFAGDELDIDTPYLPGPARLTDLSAQVGDRRIRVSRANIGLANQRWLVSMDLKHDSWQQFNGDLAMQGNVEAQLAQWIKHKNWLPPQFFPRTPCRFSRLTIALDKTGIALAADMVTPVSRRMEIKTGLDLEYKNKTLTIRKLSVTRPEESATLWAVFEQAPAPSVDIGFAGNLRQDTVSMVLEENKLLSGNITGDFQLKYVFNRPETSYWKGESRIQGFAVHAGDQRVAVNRAELIGHDAFVEIKNASLSLNEETVTADGLVSLSGNGFTTDLAVGSPFLSTGNLLRLYRAFTEKYAGGEPSPGNPAPGAATGSTASSGPTIAGSIAFDLAQFEVTPENPENSLGGRPLVWDALRGKIALLPDGKASVAVTEGTICGVSTTGVLKKPPDPLLINISAGRPAPRDIRELLACMGLEQKYVTGQCTLDARLTGLPGKWENGHVTVSAENGVLHQMPALSKIFTLINVTDLFSKSKIRNIFAEGYPYSHMKLTGDISGDRCHIREAFILGDGLDFFIKGSIGLSDNSLDLIVYAKPFKSIDSVVTTIPLVGKDLGGGEKGLVLIPIRLTGTIGKPAVAFHKGGPLENDKQYLRNLIKQTISLPSKMVDRFTPGKSLRKWLRSPSSGSKER